MEEMQITSALTWIEVQFMKKAVEEVDKCRTTLKWTYAMAYYLAKGNEKDLFEDNQRYCFFYLFLFPWVGADNFFYRDLEKAVEDLSELLESPIEAENIPTLRQQVTNKTVCLIRLSSVSIILNSRQIMYLGLRTQTKRDCIRRHRSGIFGREMEMECRCRWV